MARKKKDFMGFREGFEKLITNQAGSVSSKIVIGALTYIIITAALIVLMFVNPEFPGLSDLVSVSLVTSASLLGLTTIENIKQHRPHGDIED